MTEEDEKLLVGKAESFFQGKIHLFQQCFNVEFNTEEKATPLTFIEMREDFYIPVSIRDWTWNLHFLSLVPLYQVLLEGLEIYCKKYQIHILLDVFLINTTFNSQDCEVWWTQFLLGFQRYKKDYNSCSCKCSIFIPIKISSSFCFKGSFCDPKIQQFHNNSN